MIRSKAKREREAAAATGREQWERAFYIRYGYWPTPTQRRRAAEP